MTSLFINFTNHPSRFWDKIQTEKAQQWGEIRDMPFPAIAPDASHDDIRRLVDEYAGQILALADERTVTVHVMGEMTFTFGIVSRLKAAGIECVASTTERKVIERADGRKISTFSFVRFRPY
ncbi:MAG: CRISPR-associated protein [Bacteroidales bacterium]|nr:CRISPR-associated protein [Bacteroidales bacterium]